MNLNELLYGDLQSIADYISGDCGGLGREQIFAILTNLCRRVAALEKRESAVEKRHAELDEALAETLGG